MRWDFRQKRLSRQKSGRPTYQNPLYTKKTWQLFVIERFSFFSWLAILVVLIIIYLIFYSPLLQIKKIEIQGTKNISPQVLDEKFIRWQLEQRKWLVFKQNNIFMFSKKWLTENIEKQYSVESLQIDKKFPNTLKVNITEKTPTLIWVTNNTNYYLDENGNVSSVVTDNESIVNLPKILDEANNQVKPGQEILNKEKVSFINDLINMVKNISSVDITSYSIPHSISTQLNAQTTAGYKIYFDMNKDLAIQIDSLQRVLAESETVKSIQEYIDLRIGERVYVK